MKRYALLSILLFLLGFLNAQETIRFRTDAPQGLYMNNSSTSGLSLHYSIQELGIANFDNGEVKGQEVILRGHTQLHHLDAENLLKAVGTQSPGCF